MTTSNASKISKFIQIAWQYQLQITALHSLDFFVHWMFSVAQNDSLQLGMIFWLRLQTERMTKNEAMTTFP